MGAVRLGSVRDFVSRLSCTWWLLHATTQAQAQPLLLMESDSCLPRHCALKSSVNRKPDPFLPQLNHILLGDKRLQLSLHMLRLRVLPNDWVTLETKGLPEIKASSPGLRGTLRLRRVRELNSLTTAKRRGALLVQMRF